MCTFKYLSGWMGEYLPAHIYLHIFLGLPACFNISAVIIKMVKGQSSCTMDAQEPSQNCKI